MKPIFILLFGMLLPRLAAQDSTASFGLSVGATTGINHRFLKGPPDFMEWHTGSEYRPDCGFTAALRMKQSFFYPSLVYSFYYYSESFQHITYQTSTGLAPGFAHSWYTIQNVNARSYMHTFHLSIGIRVHKYCIIKPALGLMVEGSKTITNGAGYDIPPTTKNISYMVELETPLPKITCNIFFRMRYRFYMVGFSKDFMTRKKPKHNF